MNDYREPGEVEPEPKPAWKMPEWVPVVGAAALILAFAVGFYIIATDKKENAPEPAAPAPTCDCRCRCEVDCPDPPQPKPE